MQNTVCGHVAIVGRPNVGKSTLLNAFLQQKISITSRKPQTTQHQILGIKTQGQVQIIYLDTPGWRLSDAAAVTNKRQFNRLARGALSGVDVILLVLDATHCENPEERVAFLLNAQSAPLVVAINKIDALKDRSLLLPYLEKLQALLPKAELIPVSAKKNEQLGILEEAIVRHLPEGPFLFPADQVTDQNELFRISEIIREKIIRLVGQEVPYAARVSIVAVEDTPSLLKISAIIWVEKKGQRGILVGKGGLRMKTIGQQARLSLEKWLGKKVYLNLWVKLKSEQTT